VLHEWGILKENAKACAIRFLIGSDRSKGKVATAPTFPIQSNPAPLRLGVAPIPTTLLTVVNDVTPLALHVHDDISDVTDSTTGAPIAVGATNVLRFVEAVPR
jgi:hypothetical protein